MKICIDAGHRNNQYDFGATGNGYKESALALQIALKVEKVFHSLGHTTFLTRRTENDLISVNARPQKAKAQKCDWFISIHLNAATPSAHGVEALYRTQQKTAATMSAELSKATGFRDRGAKYRTDLGVLNGFDKAVLVECGFISNPSESKQLADSAFQDKVANAIVEGFLKAQGITVAPAAPSGKAKQVQDKYAFSDDTMAYLSAYKFADALFDGLLVKKPLSDATLAYIKAYKFGQNVLDRVYK